MIKSTKKTNDKNSRQTTTFHSSKPLSHYIWFISENFYTKLLALESEESRRYLPLHFIFINKKTDEKLLFIMTYTTILLYAKRSTAQIGTSATDLVEFYADGSPPCCKTEFN